MPNPPCERSSDRSACVKRSNTRGQQVLRDPDARIAHAKDYLIVGAVSQHVDAGVSRKFFICTDCDNAVGPALANSVQDFPKDADNFRVQSEGDDDWHRGCLHT
jgi:hypothetical protein